MSAAAHSAPALSIGEQPRAQRASTERDQLLRVAFRLIGRSHDEPVSVQQILDAADLSTRAFYRHFRSKDELIITMCRSAADLVLAGMVQVAERSPTAVVALRDLIHEQLAVVYDPRRARQTSVLTSSEARAAVGIDQVNQEAMAARRQMMADVVARGYADGVFPFAADARECARAVNGAVSSIIEAKIAGHEVPSWADATNHTTDLFLRAFGAS